MSVTKQLEEFLEFEKSHWIKCCYCDGQCAYCSDYIDKSAELAPRMARTLCDVEAACVFVRSLPDTGEQVKYFIDKILNHIQAIMEGKEGEG
jgi:hypothetical protein